MSRLILLHGFVDTFRTWDLVRPALEREHDVQAIALPGHDGGPPLDGDFLDQVASQLPDEPVHLVGNSLGGHLALRLAELGLARSVVALAPAYGQCAAATLPQFELLRANAAAVAARADALASTPEGRHKAAQLLTEHGEDLPPDLVVALLLGVARAHGAEQLIADARTLGWPLQPACITCPVRIVWGTADRVLPWPAAAAELRAVLPQADWVELDGVGHAPQLDAPVETAQLILGWI